MLVFCYYAKNALRRLWSIYDHTNVMTINLLVLVNMMMMICYGKCKIPHYSALNRVTCGGHISFILDWLNPLCKFRCTNCIITYRQINNISGYKKNWIIVLSAHFWAGVMHRVTNLCSLTFFVWHRDTRCYFIVKTTTKYQYKIIYKAFLASSSKSKANKTYISRKHLPFHELPTIRNNIYYCVL